MKFKNIATVACSIALGMMVFTSCEGGDLYKVNAPDWLADKIAEAADQGGDDQW